MKPDGRSDEEIARDLDTQAEEVLRATEGPSGLTESIGRQNPFKSAEQVLESAPPTMDNWPKGRDIDFSGMTEEGKPKITPGQTFGMYRNW